MINAHLIMYSMYFVLLIDCNEEQMNKYKLNTHEISLHANKTLSKKDSALKCVNVIYLFHSSWKQKKKA